MSKGSLNWFVYGIASILLFTVAANASADMSKREIQAEIENKYDARVLKMFIGKDLGRPVYFVRVMFKGGNYNTAFHCHNFVMERAGNNCQGHSITDLTSNRRPRFAAMYGDRGRTMKAFIYSLVAVVAISVLASVWLGELDWSSATRFTLQFVRL